MVFLLIMLLVVNCASLFSMDDTQRNEMRAQVMNAFGIRAEDFEAGERLLRTAPTMMEFLNQNRTPTNNTDNKKSENYTTGIRSAVSKESAFEIRTLDMMPHENVTQKKIEINNLIGKVVVGSYCKYENGNQSVKLLDGSFNPELQRQAYNNIRSHFIMGDPAAIKLFSLVPGELRNNNFIQSSVYNQHINELRKKFVALIQEKNKSLPYEHIPLAYANDQSDDDKEMPDFKIVVNIDSAFLKIKGQKTIAL